LAVGFDHNKNRQDRHHGVADIWSPEYNKWFVVDPQNNIHYESNGVPLNSLEIRTKYLENKAKDVRGIIGNYTKIINFNSRDTGFATPSNYFWFAISQRNNYFQQPEIYDSKNYLWIDQYNENKVWYKKVKNKSVSHPMYDGRFIQSSDKNILFPALKQKI
jgi:hypothetical protein